MRFAKALPALAAAMLLGGCIKSMALNAVADGLSASGSTFAGDDDPELVREAIPFGLKTYESILAELPEHRGLLLATASGFTQYAYAFVIEEADRLDATDLARAREMRARARKLFIRGRNYAFRGIEVGHPGFAGTIRKEPAAVLAAMTKEDVPFLYWAGVSWGAALMADKEDLDLIAELPIAGSMVERVIELDPSFNEGAAHEFLMSYEGSRPGGTPARAREKYAKALELSGGKRASVYVGLAEAVCIKEQNRAEFKKLLAAALAVDPDGVPASRLQNILARRRAQWLLTRLDEIFLEGEDKK